MADQPEALRHAQELDRRGLLEEADELRRLHAVNAELLEALKDALFHVANQGDIGVDQWLACERKARAAIAKAEGEPK